MEIVGGVASITQLTAYSHVVARRLLQLYNAVQEGPSFYHIQRSNIGFLLESIQRMCVAEAFDTDSILPLLIAAADLATSLLNLLQPAGALYKRWLWFSRSDEIENAFCALNDKTRLLQLHMTERTYSTVTHVLNRIEYMNQEFSSPTPPVDQSVCSHHRSQILVSILLTCSFLLSSSLPFPTSRP